MFSYNRSVHEGTKFTPHELVFGHLTRTPSANVTIQKTGNGSYNEYLRELQEKLVESAQLAQTNLNNSKIRSKHYYDRKIHE